MLMLRKADGLKMACPCWFVVNTHAGGLQFMILDFA
jgi:hypothetical protein